MRVLGASAYGASQVIASEKGRAMIQERGQEDWDSEYGRFPRLFQAADSIPGLTWPTLTFHRKLSVYLGTRRVEWIVVHLANPQMIAQELRVVRRDGREFDRRRSRCESRG